MKRVIWTSAFLGTVLLLCGLASAQSGLAAVSDGNSILLRWLLPDQQFPAGGFILTRTGPDGTVTLPVASPMPRQDSIAAGWVTGDEYDFLADLFQPGPRAEGSGALLGMMTLATVGRPGYARAIGTLYEDASVAEGARYTYELSTGNGTVIGAAEVLAGESAPPPPVTGLQAAVEGDAIALRWFDPPEEGLIAAYFVHRSAEGQEVLLHEGPHFPPDPDLEPDAAMYLDETAEPGVQYEYRVQSMDLFGRTALFSAPTQAFIPDPDAIAAPMISGSEPLDGSIVVQWSAVQDDRISALALLRYEDLDAEPLLLTGGFLPVTATSYTDADVTGGVHYYYALAAIDSAGNMSPESPAWAEQALNLTPPSAPAALVVEPGITTLTLSWQPVPEADVQAYRVYVSRLAQPELADLRYIASVPDTSFALEFAGESLNEFRFRVSAVNTSGVEGELSDETSARLVDETPPPAPELLGVELSGEGIWVRWQASSNPDVQTLNLYRVSDGEIPELLAAGLLPGSMRHLDAEVRAGVAYTYQLTALDASGNESEFSRPQAGLLPGQAGPAPVRGLGAALAVGGVRLTWLQQPDTRYVVERARGGGSFIQLNDPEDAGSYLDAGGTAGDHYRVIAVDAAGRVGPPTAAVEAEAR